MRSPEPARAPYISLVEAEAIYGPLIGAGNHPTEDQFGNGERVGLFRDIDGTVWGFPLIPADGNLLACAPLGVHDLKVTDTLPTGFTIAGTTNEPTGWRGGTGTLELLLRDPEGNIHRQMVHGADVAAGSNCSAPHPPGPSHQLRYYRLAQTK
jgi:hypothetical protein